MMRGRFRPLIMINICMNTYTNLKHSTYNTPPTDKFSRWNWFDSEDRDWKDGSKSMGHRHPNGGGWVADTAYVSNSCVVEKDGEVFGSARVYGSVTIKNNAAVYGNALIMGSTNIGGGGDCLVYGQSVIAGNLIWESGTIEINGATVFGQISLMSDTELTSNDSFYGTYKTKAGDISQDIKYPNSPQLHGSSSQTLVSK